MFTVVIPLYNKELSVFNTIKSVVNQTYKDFEIVIVNDGSTDKSVEVVEQIKDDRIRLIHQENQGVSAARNTGIKHAKHEWICFLDADDLWEKEHLMTLKEMISDYSRHKVFCTSYVRSNNTLPMIQDNSVIIIEDYFKEAIKHHFFWTSVTCIHNSIFDEIGGFNVLLNRGEDLELWGRIGRKYIFIRSKKITAIYRCEAENRSDLKFILEKSRVYNYQFLDNSTDSEKAYYNKQISNVLKSFIKQRKIEDFIKLKKKHKGFISFSDILKY
ncbi:glycosyltransferase family 2 protein [Aequorivita aquimaris]|uniref:glycosyltransferase family 2 protein n=1 Tax=Aequorivita aquimaris TaxID=1548749 RepID=UPI000788917A|nr:glycosyltransferase family 2 protein [Aequorivita aquimaris]